MTKVIDLQGYVFGRLTVLSRADNVARSKTTVVAWNCLCECGTCVIVTSAELRADKTKSCGCLHNELLSLQQTTHGMSKTRQYRIWKSLRARCDNDVTENYGTRGITYCEKWKTFEGFWEDMSDGYSDDLELDRINVDGNYTKENCRWVDGSLQSYNQRLRSDNLSGRVGVRFNYPTNKWHARISINGDCIFLGSYMTKEAACLAREEAELKYFGFIKG